MRLDAQILQFIPHARRKRSRRRAFPARSNRRERALPLLARTPHAAPSSSLGRVRLYRDRVMGDPRDAPASSSPFASSLRQIRPARSRRLWQLARIRLPRSNLPQRVPLIFRIERPRRLPRRQPRAHSPQRPLAILSDIPLHVRRVRLRRLALRHQREPVPHLPRASLPHHHRRPLEGWREGNAQPRTLFRLDHTGARHAVPRPVRAHPRTLQRGGRARQPHRAAAHAYIERAVRRVADHRDSVHRGGDPLTIDVEQLVEAADACRGRG